MSEGSDKLDRTRLAIIEHILHKKEGKQGGLLSRRPPPVEITDGRQLRPAPSGGALARLGGLTDAGRNWWRHHPANTVLDLATPALSAYARRRPGRFLGIAVVGGALFMLTRPWRLLSITGIAVALIKSSALPGMVMSALSAAGYGASDDEVADVDPDRY